MVSSSPSFKRCHKKPVSLCSLPDDLLLEISSCVGASSSSFSLSEINNLHSVSKSFRRLCHEPYFLRRLSVSTVHFIHMTPKLADKFTKIVESGNPEALFSKRFADYSHHESDEEQDRAIGYIAKAAEEGHQKAKYLNGVISICLGDKTKQKGFEILSSYKKLLMSNTMRKMDIIQKETKDRIWCYKNALIAKLKESYVREKCRCDGRTEKFIKERGWFWHHNERVWFWHHDYFFRL